MSSKLENSKNLKFYQIIGLLPLVVIVVFYWISVKYSINIPWFDDVENIPYFLINFIGGENWADKWKAIILPNNEHRVLTARSIVLMQYLISGHLNFRVLSFFGNLSVLFLFSFIARGYLRQGGKWYMLAPVAFFIFNFQSYNGIFMTIMSMQYQMVIMLSAASFYFLSKQSTRFFIIAILIAYLDTFSMGNGMMVWPSAIVMLLFQERWKETVIWTIAGGIAVFLYFHGQDFVQGNDKAFAYIAQYPFKTFLAFFAMLGGDFDVFPNAVFAKRALIPMATGFVLFAIFIIWLVGILSSSPFWGSRMPVWIKNKFRTLPFIQNEDNRWNAFWLGTFMYVMISMLLVVVFRTRFDPHIILGSTYKMYPAVMTSVVYIVVIQVFVGKWQLPYFVLGLVVSIGVWLSTFVNYIPVIKNIKMTRTAFAFNQKTNGVGLGATKNSAFEKMLESTLRKADSLGIYSYPDPLIAKGENDISLTGLPASAKVQINDYGDILIVKPTANSDPGKVRYIVLESPENRYLFFVMEDDSSASCPKGTIRAGKYEVGIGTVSGSRASIERSSETVTIE